jgi:hypothetical protein
MAPSTAPVTLPPCSHGGLARLSGLGSPGRVSSPLRRSEPTWPWRLTRLALVLAVLLVGRSLPCDAQARQGPTPGVAPDQPGAIQPETSEPRQDAPTALVTPEQPTPQAPVPLLRDRIPTLGEAMQTLPPFWRDTSLKLHLRTFYFNRQNSDDTANEAWAVGGWLAYTSGWLWDTAAIGAVGYTSQPLYAPDSRDGTLLLGPNQSSLLVLGQLYGQLRYKEYALLTGYRQLVDQGYVNPQDSRMIPNTFEGVTVGGTLGPVDYALGYLSQIKTRNADSFVSMAQAAGVPDRERGLVLTSLKVAPRKDLKLYAANYLVPDVFNTAYGTAEYTHPLPNELRLNVGLQYTDQRSIGSALLGDFVTWNVGMRGLVLWRGLTAGVAFHVPGDEAALRTPYGTWPGYLSFIEKDFDQAGQKAWGVGVKYDFGGTLLPGLRLPQLAVVLKYAQGTDARNPATGQGLPTVREGDLDLTWNVLRVKGLSFRFRNAYVAQGGERVLMDFRLILNYEVPVL